MLAQPPTARSGLTFHTNDPDGLAELIEWHGYQRRFTRRVTEVAQLRHASTLVVIFHTGLVIGLGSDASSMLELLSFVYPTILEPCEVAA